MSDSVKISKEEFHARFRARMIARVGEKDFGGDSVGDYADGVWESYWAEGTCDCEPEECADDDLYYGAQDAG